MNKQRLVVLGSDSFIIPLYFLEKVKDDYNLVKITRKEVNLLKENTNLKIKRLVKKMILLFLLQQSLQ